MHLIQQFISLGFNNEEANIYLSLLQIKTGSASNIARKANLKRLVTYNTLEGLRKKGLVGTYAYNGITQYTAIPFAQLKQKIELEIVQKQSTLEDLEHKIQEFLAANQVYIQQAEATLYTGINGLKSLYEQTLLEPSLIYAMIGTDSNKDESFLEYLYDSYVPRRNATIPDIKTIFSKVAYERYKENYNKRGWQRNEDRVKCVDESRLPIVGGIILYGRKNVALTSYNLHGASALIYNSQAFYDSMLAIFLALRNTQEFFQSS